MDWDKRTSWTEADLTHLFADHFGDKLSPMQLERLVADTAAGLADRRQRQGPSASASRGAAEGWLPER